MVGLIDILSFYLKKKELEKKAKVFRQEIEAVKKDARFSDRYRAEITYVMLKKIRSVESEIQNIKGHLSLS